MNNRNMLRGPLSNESEVTNQLRPQSSDSTSPINKHLIDVMMHTTQEWQDREGYVPPEDSMAIYTDYRATSGGIDIPGIKIGDGATPIEDLPFITDWEAGKYSCVKSGGSGITSAVCCNGNIIINGSAGTYVMTLSNFYESFMKSIGGYSLTKASQSDVDKIDELAFLMSNSYIIKQPTGTGTSFTRYSNSYQLAAYGSGTKIISFTFGESINGTRLLIDSNGVTITLV